jgi:hypothetical protein
MPPEWPEALSIFHRGTDAMTMSTRLGNAPLLYAFQGVLILLVAFAELQECGWFMKWTGADATVSRGEVSWNALSICFGIIAVNVLQIINSADDSVRFKVLMSTFDLAVMIRLFFFNGWFRNQALLLVGKTRQLEEGRRPISGRPHRNGVAEPLATAGKGTADGE